MDTLDFSELSDDFSELSDDQLIGLVRAALQEAVRRNPIVCDAMRGEVLDEAEKATIAKDAAGREAARLRALERERIANEAAAAVRKQAEAQAAIDREVRIAKEVAEATAKAAENGLRAGRSGPHRRHSRPQLDQRDRDAQRSEVRCRHPRADKSGARPLRARAPRGLRGRSHEPHQNRPRIRGQKGRTDSVLCGTGRPLGKLSRRSDFR